MAYSFPGSGALDYYPCRYGGSKLMFRGPKRDLDRSFAVALGGSETYGKFLPRPWPALVEGVTGRRIVNLGCVNAGPDVLLGEPEIVGIASRAAFTVLQIVGAGNMSNAYYTVHPRRNDRFLRPEAALTQLFPEVDFTDFHFTRHLLLSLMQRDPQRFARVAAELRTAWIARMRSLITQIDSPVVLLWMGGRKPPARADRLDAEPLLVDAEMVAAVRGHAAAYLEVVFSHRARQEGLGGKSFAEIERAAADELPGPLAHREVAEALVGVVRKLF